MSTLNHSITIALSLIFLLINTYSSALADASPGKIKAPVLSGQFSVLREPSGVTALDHNTLIIVEDEASSALRSLSLVTDDPSHLRIEESDQFFGKKFIEGLMLAPLDDLEGIARVSPTQFIVTGSHESARKGKWPDREKLVLFTLEDTEIVSAQIRQNLYKKMKKQFPELREIMKKNASRGRQPLNIEAIAYDRKRLKLHIGLRTPIADDVDDAEAFIITMENALEYLAGSKPVFVEKMHRLYLGKGGIRALAYDDSSDKLLIISRRESGKKKRFQMWSVPADLTEQPTRHKSKDKNLFENVEGLTPFAGGILYIRDNGDRIDLETDDWFILQRSQLGLADKQHHSPSE